MKTAYQMGLTMTQEEIQTEIDGITQEIGRLESERMRLMQRRKECERGLRERATRDMIRARGLL